MAAGNGSAAFGSLLQRGNGATPEVWTTIAEVTNISGPSLSHEVIDVTSHSSSGAFREKVGGLLDGGEITLDLNFVPAGATHKEAVGGLLYDMTARSVNNYKLIFPDTTYWIVPALVTNFTPDMAVDGKLGASVTITVSGEPTLA